MSRPAWGAWIGTLECLVVDGRAPCRAPHGARGLKRIVVEPFEELIASRPAWGAWIETHICEDRMLPSPSRPAWGAWIETTR